MKVILYNDNENLVVLHVNEQYQKQVQMVADKDVPPGISYIIVDVSVLPKDKTYRHLWKCEINKSNRTGFGLNKNQFIEKYPEFAEWVRYV